MYDDDDDYWEHDLWLEQQTLFMRGADFKFITNTNNERVPPMRSSWVACGGLLEDIHFGKGITQKSDDMPGLTAFYVNENSCRLLAKFWDYLRDKFPTELDLALQRARKIRDGDQKKSVIQRNKRVVD